MAPKAIRRKKCPACGRLGEPRKYRSGDRMFIHASHVSLGLFRMVDDHCYIPASKESGKQHGAE